MPSAYILLLIVSLAAVWVYWQNSRDIFVLFVFAGLGCFILGFSWAPWTVQLLIVALLLGWQKFYLQGNQSCE
jgi:chromate transport protein ChrA